MHKLQLSFVMSLAIPGISFAQDNFHSEISKIPPQIQRLFLKSLLNMVGTGVGFFLQALIINMFKKS